LTQADACRAAKIEPNTWNQYEKGINRISLDKAALICEAFNVTLDWLYRGNAAGLPFSFAARLREMAS
jgi:transcriptional regulator with XRE-family HTH domain